MLTSEIDMRPRRVLRIHVTGASGSGTSTLGAMLADRFDIPHFDIDDYFWMPTDPPYASMRPVEERIRLIEGILSGLESWILTGSCMGWGDGLVQAADLIVFLHLPGSVRLERLDRREAERFGSRIDAGGDMHAIHIAFREWATQYEDPDFTGRSLAQHERWLECRTNRVLRLESLDTPQGLAERVEAAVGVFI